MISVLTGFAVVALAVIVGYVIGRIDLLGPAAPMVLARLTLFVLAPFLLFTVLAEADLMLLFSSLLPVSALAAITMFAVYALIARLLWNRNWGSVTIGALGSGYVNGNNIGIPIATYLLGNAAYSAPIILVQLLVFTPIALAILDANSLGKVAIWRLVLRTLSNPMIVGSALGVVVALANIELTPVIFEPIKLIAAACIPLMLINFGMSLSGQRVLTHQGTRRDILLATGLKLLVMPVTAWLLAAVAFRLDAQSVLAIVVLASLPSAQNVFTYAQRYEVSTVLARDVVLLTTIGCIPVLLASTLLLS